MLLCLDIGNTHIYAGIFEQDNLLLQFRYASKQNATSDQIGVFLRNVLKENKINPDSIRNIAICSVVPSLDYSLRAACSKYFDITPFMLDASVDTGLTLHYRNPQEIGSDRIANAIAALALYPNKNLIIVDFGTATTLCAITAKKDYLGGMIFPGIKLSMEALHENTAKLMSVEIVQPAQVIGQSTAESLQSGIYYSQLATIKEVAARINEESFDEEAAIIATGGFAQLFASENIFTDIKAELVLYGLRIAQQNM